MKGMDMFNAIARLDPDLTVTEPASGKRPGRGARSDVRVLTAAASILLAAVFCLSAAFAAAAENAEFREAGIFFKENGLDPEGLSRSELKAVYRDITSNSFTYGKTAEVIIKSIQGYEINPEEPSPEELAQLWYRKANGQTITVRDLPVTAYGYEYRCEDVYVFNEDRGGNVFEKSVVNCYFEGTRVWSAEFEGTVVTSAVHTSTGTAVWGWKQNDSHLSFLGKIDDSGNVSWQLYTKSTGDAEIDTVLENKDGSWSVFASGRGQYLYIIAVAPDGSELSVIKAGSGGRRVRKAAILGDGYILELAPAENLAYDGELVRIDREGNMGNAFSFEENGRVFRVTDMIEFGNSFYLSGYSVPKQTDEGGRNEIADLLDWAWENKLFNERNSDKLTPKVRENYTAVLLRCGAGSADPESFYTVAGAIGGKLSMDGEGRLIWNAEQIVSSVFNPAMSAYSFMTKCRVYRYAFNQQGEFVGSEDSGEETVFSR